MGAGKSGSWIRAIPRALACEVPSTGRCEIRRGSDVSWAPGMRGAVAALALGLAREAGDPEPPWASGWLQLDEPDAVVTSALTHRIGDVAASVLAGVGFPPSEVERLRPADTDQLKAMLRAAALNRARGALEKAGLPVLAVKGAALSALTAQGWLARKSADVDLYMDLSDILEATRALEAAGFQRDESFCPAPDSPLFDAASKRVQEMSFSGRGTHIDLHWRLDPSRGCFTPDFAALWSRRQYAEVAGVSVPTLGQVDSALFNAVHAGKDCWRSLHLLRDQVRLQRLNDLTPTEWLAAAEQASCRVRWLVAQEMIAQIQLQHGGEPTIDEELQHAPGAARARLIGEKLWEALASSRSPRSRGKPRDQARYLAFNVASCDTVRAGAQRMGVVAWPIKEMAGESMGPLGNRHPWLYPLAAPLHVPRRMSAKDMASGGAAVAGDSDSDAVERAATSGPGPDAGPWHFHDVGGVRVAFASVDAALAELLRQAQMRAGLPTDGADLADGEPSGAGLAVHFANAYTISLASQDPAYAGLLNNQHSLVLNDGRPLLWAAKLAHRGAEAGTGAEWEQVCGPDTMPAVLELTEGTEISHYFLGGTEATLQALMVRIGERYPGAKVAGWESPPFRDLTAAEQRAQLDRIRESGASIVWVGLGTPKQDWVSAHLAAELPVLAMAVGAAFDFIAGTKPEAPGWARRGGLEWAFRWASEPRRLTGRYVVGNWRFVRAVVGEWRQPPGYSGGGHR